MKSQPNSHQQQFQMYKQRQKTISSIMELLPGLNDISDAFEALPMDLIKYFTLLKEIDAKCIGTIPQINSLIDRYIDKLHPNTGATNEVNGSTDDSANGKVDGSDNVNDNNAQKPINDGSEGTNLFLKPDQFKHMTVIKNKLNEVVPCLEEKMQVTRVASDLMEKHMMRINDDYKLIINNNEIPESIRIGPLNHPAMIMDPAINNNQDRSVQAVRSESRREALAAKKASKEEETKRRGGRDGSSLEKTPPESSPVSSGNSNTNNLPNSTTSATGAGGLGNGNKKRGRNEDIFRATTPVNGAKKKKTTKKEELEEEQNAKTMRPSSGLKSGEPTYCYCNQVSFGEMVGCDGDDCKREWFHLPCIGFKNPPKGKWYCEDCTIKMKKVKRI
jgi:hypothetical protein